MDFETVCPEAVENFPGEMQPGGRSGDSARLRCENSLVALAVGGLIEAINVRQQRHVAQALERGVEVLPGMKAERTLSEFSAADDFGFEFALAKYHVFARGQFPSRMNQRFPNVRLQLTSQQDFDWRAQEFALHPRLLGGRLCANPRAASQQTSRDDSRGIYDDHFVAAEQVRQIAELAVLPGACCAVQKQHARGVALGKRALRNQLGGKIVVERGQFHNAGEFISFFPGLAILQPPHKPLAAKCSCKSHLARCRLRDWQRRKLRVTY